MIVSICPVKARVSSPPFESGELRHRSLAVSPKIRRVAVPRSPVSPARGRTQSGVLFAARGGSPGLAGVHNARSVGWRWTYEEQLGVVLCVANSTLAYASRLRVKSKPRAVDRAAGLAPWCAQGFHVPAWCASGREPMHL